LKEDAESLCETSSSTCGIGVGTDGGSEGDSGGDTDDGKSLRLPESGTGHGPAEAASCSPVYVCVASRLLEGVTSDGWNIFPTMTL
jgi:hypothetical protein